MIVAWRISKRLYSPFDGIGSSVAGGRWNSPGFPVVYTSASRSLAILECLVHAELRSVLENCDLYSVEFEDELVEVLEIGAGPIDWFSEAEMARSKSFGDRWITSSDKPILRVPSAVLNGEDNFVLNVNHPRFSEITLGTPQPFPIDKRLIS